MENGITLIQTLGFPIAVCCIMMWYIYDKDKRHAEESKQFSEALNKNTVVVAKLEEMLNTIINLFNNK